MSKSKLGLLMASLWSMPSALNWNIRRCGIWFLLLLVFSIPLAYSEMFFHPFMALKWTLFYFCAAISSAYLIFSRSLFLPRGPLLTTTVVLLGFKILSVALTPNWYSFHSLLNALVIGILCLAFLNMFLEKRLSLDDFYGPLSISTVIILGFAWVQYYFHRMINHAEDPQYFSTLFGNINYSSQYFVMSVPLFAYFVQTKKGWRQAGANFFLINLLFFTLAGLSRSSIIGICLWFVYRLFTKITRAEFACVLIAGLMLLGHWNMDTKDHFYSNAKAGSFVKRTELYQGSLRMLADYPFGIGGEAFEYGYVPYQLFTKEAPTPEEMYINPHSEFLKWGIENGWGFLVSAILWFALFLWQIRKSQMKREDRILLFSMYAAVAADVAFQFPFDNAPTSILFCIYFAFGFSLLPNQRLDFKKARGLWLPVTILLFANATAYGLSKYNEGSHLNEVDATTLACDLYPVNYRVCFYSARGLAPRFALSPLVMELKQRPFNYSHLRLFAVTLHQGLRDTREACEVQAMYLQIFPQQPAFLFCDQYKDIAPLPFENPTQFRDDFTARLNPILEKYSNP